MAWVGLERYGYLDEAQRLAYRFLYMFVPCFIPSLMHLNVLAG
jgi:alpha,alpha-trehalase